MSVGETPGEGREFYDFNLVLFLSDHEIRDHPNDFPKSENHDELFIYL